MMMLGSMLWGVSLCAAQGTQETPSPDAIGPPTMLADQIPLFAAASVAQTPGQPSWIGERRACEGCPPRSVGRALFQTTVVNVVYGLANLARGQVTAKVTPKTWWHNMEQGWVWDLDDFTVNQIGHPYQGNNYFTTGRANGLSFYESAAVTAFGSATWEYFGETNHASLNDFINTTLGGIALGEMFHRTAWLVRDTRATGRGRLWREIGATALDPITGANRFIRGDASRVTDKPADMVPSNLSAFGAAGVLWRGTEDNAFTASPQAFFEVDAVYGDPDQGHSRTPYDAFAMKLRFGGGSGLSEARVRGRLLGQPLKDGAIQFSVVQSYDFQKNDAYATGSQSFEGAFGFTQNLSSTTRFLMLGWAGLTVLGAIDSLPLGLTEIPEEGEETGDAGQGVSEGPRYYDYGPGSDFGVTAIFSRNNRPFATIFYEGRHLYSLDGVRANHFLQRGRLDLVLPLRGAFGVGFTGEYLRSTDLLPGRRRHAHQLPLPAGARLLHVGAVVNLTMHTWVRGLCLLALAPALAFAQTAPQAPSSQPPATAGGASNVWFVAGGAFATMRGDCQTCEEDYPYRHSGAVLGDIGIRVNPRMDVGFEVYWMPIDTAQGNIRTTHFDAVAQFRPWASQGFFVKGGAGMAFVRNWVDVLGSDSFNEKALSVVIGAGWAFRPTGRLGLEVFGTQHALAMGDLQASEGLIQDVIGNRWSFGAAVVIR